MADFRPGQWVLYGRDREVGIFVKDNKNGTAEVDLVNNEGETRLSIVTEKMKLKSASVEDIPKARLRTSNQKVLRRFYKAQRR